jgi:hypothetical protein
MNKTTHNGKYINAKSEDHSNTLPRSEATAKYMLLAEKDKFSLSSFRDSEYLEKI